MTEKITREIENDLKLLSMVPSQLELDALIEKRIALYKQSQTATARQKAGEYVEFQQEVFRLTNPKNTRQPWCLITINPREGVEYELLDDKVEYMVEDWFTWSVRTYELSKTGRLHCHLLGLIKPEKQNANFYRIKGPFISETMCENVKHIDVRYVTKEDLKRTYSYITKAIVGNSKQEAHVRTLKWREENRIPETIPRGDIPTCLSPPTLGLINLN